MVADSAVEIWQETVYMITSFEELDYNVDQIPPPSVWRELCPEKTQLALEGIRRMNEYIIREMLGCPGDYDDLPGQSQHDYHALMVGYLTEHWTYLRPYVKARTDELLLPFWLVKNRASDNDRDYSVYSPVPELTSASAHSFQFEIGIRFLEKFSKDPCEASFVI